MVRLSFDTLALERCFLVADILADDHARPKTEYALVGLATEDDPLHVVATRLLPGQRVTTSTVEQSGYDVLQMRREIAELSASLQRRLVPIAFIHRHPGCCTASAVDHEFLTGVWIDQISTAVSWTEVVPIGPGRAPCGCAGMERLWRDDESKGGPTRNLRLEYSLCFSLIVNAKREHEIYAARSDVCPLCQHRRVREVEARLDTTVHSAPPAEPRADLRRRLAVEVAEKIVFAPSDARVGE